MKICSKCILDENFPGISFDENGICSFCQKAPALDERSSLQSEYRQKFQDLIEARKGQGDYDLIMAYSGGKDSTYTLELLRREYGLKILAVTFDNGFISPFALENIRHMVDVLDVDHMLVRPSFRILKRIFSETARRDIFPRKALERASSICTCCIGFVKAILLKTALEKRVPFIGFGWSPGQAPIQSSVMKTNPRMAAMTIKSFWPKLEKIAGEDLSRFYPTRQQLSMQQASMFPVNVHPLAFHPYDEASIKDHISSLGWKAPPDTDPNSSNCLLNAFANQVHLERLGFHPYAWEMAGIVRAGGVSRQDALEKIYEPADPGLVKAVMEKLEIKL